MVPMNDERLAAELGELIARIDPVPQDVTLAARSALAWHGIDAELAELLEQEDALAIRSDDGWRLLVFQASGGRAVELEIDRPTGSTRNIMGQVIPPQAVPVEARTPDVTLATTADAIGRFRIHDVPAGPVNVRVTYPDAPVDTGWVTL